MTFAWSGVEMKVCERSSVATSVDQKLWTDHLSTCQKNDCAYVQEARDNR